MKGQVHMKKIIDITSDELFFRFPINRAVEVDVNCQFKTVENVDYDDGYKRVMKEYITETSNEYMSLIDFIKTKEMAAYGMCPCCKKTINFRVMSNVELSKDVCKREVLYYNDTFSDDYLIDIPDPDVTMDVRIISLLEESKFIDKYLICPLCNKTYRVSFALEFENTEKKKRILLIKIGQYPSLHEFANEDLSLLEKILRKFKIKEDYRNAMRMHTDDYNIAAYVYLRRVLEKIVLSKYNENKNAVDAELVQQMKLEIEGKTKAESNAERKREVEEKVKQKYSGGFMHLDFVGKLKALKEYVPDFFTDNPEIYGVVSAGIHSLEENKCKEYYDILKQAVDIILYEEEAKRKKEELIKNTKQGIQKAVGEIRTNV